jgi:hypothetical protein
MSNIVPPHRAWKGWKEGEERMRFTSRMPEKEKEDTKTVFRKLWIDHPLVSQSFVEGVEFLYCNDRKIFCRQMPPSDPRDDYFHMGKITRKYLEEIYCNFYNKHKAWIRVLTPDQFKELQQWDDRLRANETELPEPSKSVLSVRRGLGVAALRACSPAQLRCHWPSPKQ